MAKDASLTTVLEMLSHRSAGIGSRLQDAVGMIAVYRENGKQELLDLAIRQIRAEIDALGTRD